MPSKTNPELLAMQRIERIFDTLGGNARRRTITWLSDKYIPTPTPIPMVSITDMPGAAE